MRHGDTMRYLGTTPAQRAELLRIIGADDGGSALAEAALMAHGVTERDQIVVSGAVSPLARRVVATYDAGLRLPITTVPWADGVTDLDALRRAVSDRTAGVMVQYPNFFGA